MGAFTKKDWVNREVALTTKLNAAGLNDLEARIAAGIDGVEGALGGSRVAGLGASWTSANGTRPGHDLSSNGYLAWMMLLSSGALKYAGHVGAGGVTIQTVRDTLLPALFALPGPKPDYCVIDAATNNMNDSDELAAAKAAFVQIVQGLRAGRIEPVAANVPPRDSGTSGQYLNIAKWNAWLARYCELNGIIYVDWHSLLVDPATQGFKSGLLLAGDGTGLHTGPAGAKLIGQALVDALIFRRPFWTPKLRTNNADPLDLLTNGCFLTDTNTDGLADGWTQVASTTGTVETLVTDAAIVGKWQRIAHTGTGTTMIVSTTPFVLTPGNRIRWSGRLKVNSISTGAALNLFVSGPSLAQFGTDEANFIGWVVTPVTGAFEFDFKVPAAGPSTGQLIFSIAGAAADAQIAQQSLVDLTALGIS